MEGGELRGERIVSLGEIGDTVNVDLHMVPGILTLKNCEEYQVTVIPRDKTSPMSGMYPHHRLTHNRNKVSSNLGMEGIWYLGTSVEFMYVLENGQVPNQITLDNVLDEVNAKDVRLSWGTPFTCSDFRVVVRYDDRFRQFIQHDLKSKVSCNLY